MRNLRNLRILNSDFGFAQAARTLGKGFVSWRRFLGLIIYLAVFVAIVFDWKLGEPLIFAGSPYEAWDECMGYTQATRMDLATRFGKATYGSVEELKFRVAKFFYKYFDPVGKHLTPRRWTNNVLSSYLRSSAIFNPGFDWTYTRGILDRRPYIIARYINTLGGLILAAILCFFWLVRFRYQALFLVVPLLWFLVSLGYLLEAVTVTPNAWNALLAMMIFVCLIDVIERRSPVGLYVSAAVLGFGANSKIDFLLLGVPVAATWLVAGFEAGTWFRRWVRPVLLCGLLFLAMLFLTNPRLLYALPLAIGEQLRLLGQVRDVTVSSGTPSNVYNHLLLLKEFINHCLGAPWDVANLESLSAVIALAICLLFPLSVIFSSNLDPLRKRSVLVVLSFFYSSLWLIPLLFAGVAYDRYFLSGSAIAMISVGYCGRYLWGEKSRLGRSLGLLIVCLCAIVYVGQAKFVGFAASAIGAQQTDGLDRTFSRNQAVLEIIKLIESGNYSRQVIIDQHSYTDVRAFIEKGIPVVLINLFNYQQELEKIEHADKPTLGLYAVGKGEAPFPQWEGKWNDEERALYDRYLKYLSGFKTVAKFGNNPMFLLDWGPVDSGDEIVIFEVRPRPKLARNRDCP